ncbi:MAG TPA: LA2681 family HEPN domain-containing protein [Candidatus Tumulicola sp.]|jgi:tetratricopeptide (TPR) repeat protein
MSTRESAPNDSAAEGRLEKLLGTINVERLETPEALSALGALIDLAGDLKRSDGLDLALDWAGSLATRQLASSEGMTLQFFTGNAWLEKYASALSKGARQSHDWSQPELKNAILALRSVVANESFAGWPLVRRAQLYTNLGNALSTLGRSLEAIAYRDKALSLIPTFGMALGTRAESIDAFRGVLYRSEDIHAYLVAASEGFAAATARDAAYESTGYAPVIERWSKRCTELQSWLVERPGDAPPDIEVDPAIPESVYRGWCWRQRLIVNPLNDLGRPTRQAMVDNLHLPPIAPHDQTAELLFGYLDTLKQEFCSARWSLYEAITAREQHFSDRITHHDTGDKPLHGLWIERIKSAYRVAYSVFDKVALFLNVYFELEMPAGDVTFSKVWGKQPLEPRVIFTASNNLPLRGLYWISRDLGERGFKDVTEPDAQGMAELRNYIEHRFVRVVAAYGLTGSGAQGLLYRVTLRDFQRRAITILRLAREALIMLVSAVYVEERRKGPNRGPWTALKKL